VDLLTLSRATASRSAMKRLGAGAIPLLAIAALTLLTYRYVLSLSFMLDDFNDLPRAATSPLFTLLTSAQGYSYYRPLALLAERLPYALRGYYDPVWYHFLPLLFHAINGWLVYHLARRLAGAGTAVWAAALFVLYPLSYQVVPWAGAVMHPLVTCFVLGCLLAYYEGRCRPSRVWMGLAMLFAFLAPVTHENGAVVGPMILALELFLWRKKRVRMPSAISSAFLAPGLAFVAVWLVVPKSGNPWAIEPESIGRNTLFFLQGLVYPVSGGLGTISRWLGLPAEGIAWAILPLVMAALGLVYFRLRVGSFFLLAIMWFIPAVLPAWALLSYSYVIDGPRLLYLASVPVSLLWAGLWQAFDGKGRRAMIGRLGLLALMGGIMWQSWDFLGVRREMFEAGSRLVFQVADAISPGSPTPRTVFVNVPSWFNSKQPEYPIGHMGVTFIPDYAGLNRVAFMHRGLEPKIQSLAFADLLKRTRYDYAPHGTGVAPEDLYRAVGQADQVVVATYGPEGVALGLAGRIGRAEPTGLSAGLAPLADFSGRFALLAGRVSTSGNAVLVELEWLSRKPVEEDLTHFVHVYDASGHMVTQEDGYPIHGTFPFRSWTPGMTISESRSVDLPSGLAFGDYSVVVGVYDRASGKREPATSGSGQPYADDVVRLGAIHLSDGEKTPQIQ